MANVRVHRARSAARARAGPNFVSVAMSHSLVLSGVTTTPGGWSRSAMVASLITASRADARPPTPSALEGAC